MASLVRELESEPIEAQVRTDGFPLRPDLLLRARFAIGILISLVAAARATTLFLSKPGGGFLNEPVLWLLAAATIFGAMVMPVASRPWNLDEPGLLLPVGRDQPLIAAFLLGVATIVAYMSNAVPMLVVVAGWLTSQVLFLGALLPRKRCGIKLNSVQWLELAGVGAILLGAAWIRLYNIESFPLGLHGDLASYGLEARRLLAGDYQDFFGFGWAAIPLIAYWPTALSMLVIGDSIAGLNAIAGVEGVLSLLALYLLVRELWGRRPAIFALVICAGDLYHIHYSRAAAYMDPVVFVAWALFFLVRAQRRGQAWEFAAAGIAASYAVQMYYAGRLIIPLTMAVVAVGAIAAPRAIWSRRWGLAIWAVGFALALGPSIVSWTNSPALVGERTGIVWVLGNQRAMEHLGWKYGVSPNETLVVIVEQFRRSALVFWRDSDSATQFGIERPWLNRLGGVLFILGLGYAARFIRRPGEKLVLIWLAGFIASSTLTIDPPASMRTVGMALPIAVICALGLDAAVQAMSGRRRAQAALALTLGLLIAFSVSAQNWQTYVTWGTDPRAEQPRIQIARYLLAQPPVYEVRTVSRSLWWKDREFAFILKDWKGESLQPEDVASGSVAWPTEPTVFILTTDSENLLPVIQARYPGGRIGGGGESPFTSAFVAFYTP
jgi:4-amino-4-deoxy-L-arabinose transferase-like glycosyltransferase